MATKITEIDYDSMITKASSIANAANSMQNDVKAAFEKIKEMREDWFGNSYDNFIDVVNMSIQALNKLFEVTVSDIPHEIAAKAKSYASANQTTPTNTLQEQTAIILAEIEKTGKGTKIRFKETEVTQAQNIINSKFESAKTYASNASTYAESLSEDWDSLSGDSNIQELKTAFSRVKTILENLSSSLKNHINAQSATINAIETAANAAEAVGDIAEDAVDTVVNAAESAVNTIQQSASQLWKNLTGKN